MSLATGPPGLAHSVEEVPLTLRKLGVAVAFAAVSALVLVSIVTGSTAAYAAVPGPPTIDQTFDPWITIYDQPSGVKGLMDAGVDTVFVSVSSDNITYTPFCTIPNPTTATNWFCSSGVGATFTSALQPGLNYLRATAVNADGTSTPSTPITITLVDAPTIITPANGAYTNNNEPSFSGTASPTTTSIDVIGAGSSTIFCTNVPVIGGVWSCTTDSGPVADGEWLYLAVGSPGNEVFSEDRTINIDTVLNPPLTDITGPPGTVTVGGTLQSATNDASPIITGTSEPFATITMWQDYVEVFCAGGAPIADAAGNWSCTLAQPLTATDVYTFGSQQTDRAGNTNVGSSPDPQLELTYTDTTPPLPPVITSPIDAEFALAYTALTNNTSPTISGTGEPGAHLSLTIDGSPDACTNPVTVDPAGDWACLIPGMSEGQFSLSFTQTDLGGNVSAPAPKPLTLTIDTTPPSAFDLWTPVGTFAAGLTTATTTSAHPFLSGAGENGAAMQIYVDGSTPVACEEGPPVTGEGGFGCTVSAALAPGVHDFAFSQTDAAGNSSGEPVVRLRLTVVRPPVALPPPVPATLELIAWLLQFTTNTSNPTPGQQVTLTGSNLPPRSTVVGELHSDPVTLGTTTVKDDGTFTLNTRIPYTVEPGAHHYVVTVTPPDGDPQTSQIPVTIVAAPKTVIPAPVAAPEATRPPVHSGSTDAASADRADPAAPSTLSQSLPTIQEVLGNPIVFGTAAASSLALLFLVALPAELLNSTLDENYQRLFGRRRRSKLPWLERLRNRFRRTPIVGGLTLTTVAALILSFSDPRFGFDLTSLRLFLACAIGMFVLGWIANVVTSAILKRRWNIATVIELEPFGLVIALAGVVLSRLLDFAPGLLIGLVLSLSLSASAKLKDEAKYVLTWAGVVLGLSILGWVGYSFFSGVVAPDTFAGALLNDTLVAVATEGISALVIGLLPIGFLDGRSLFHYSKRQWLGTYLVTLVAFFVIVVPSGALWGDIDGSFWVWLTVLLVFAALCVSVYLWFRAHPEGEEVVDVGDGESADEVTA